MFHTRTLHRFGGASSIKQETYSCNLNEPDLSEEDDLVVADPVQLLPEDFVVLGEALCDTYDGCRLRHRLRRQRLAGRVCSPRAMAEHSDETCLPHDCVNPAITAEQTKSGNWHMVSKWYDARFAAAEHTTGA